jgi:NAD(P)-dependent dehydrogenase (short-subunit alcohol dehydrogenase family)
MRNLTEFDVNGRIALVTGAAKGIGFEVARLLHSRGASVTITDLHQGHSEQAASAIGAERTLAIEADVRDPGALEAAVSTTVERFGDAGDFDRVIDINLTGVSNTVRAALPEIIARRGLVVVVASVYAFVNGVLAMPYAMSKAAVEQMGRALRVELAPQGASATVAYFGFVDTDMVRDAFEDPVSTRLESLVPRFITRRITPTQAAEALVQGIERRAPRVIAPRWWRVHSVLRGLINPVFDARAEKDERFQQVVREGLAAATPADAEKPRSAA